MHGDPTDDPGLLASALFALLILVLVAIALRDAA